MKLGISIVLILVASLLKAQTKTITIFSEKDNKPLTNVLIYHKANLIGESKVDGTVTLELKNVDSLTFVKNGYEHLILSKNQLRNNVNLHKSDVISLNEVTVSPMSVKKLLIKINEFLSNKMQNGKANYKIPTHLHVYNQFMANNDTLHFLNNRLVNKGKDGFKINAQTKLVKKFTHYKNKEILIEMYQWNNYKTNFWDMFTYTPVYLISNQFSNVYFNQKLFDFKIVEDEVYYKLEFKQKRKFSVDEPRIEGYMIVDKFDYGVYEFVSRLLNNDVSAVKIINFSNNRPITFKILNDTYKFKYTKENDTYILKSSTRNTNFIQEKGEFKNINFVCNIQVERTINFKDLSLKKFNIFNWDIE
jgi:hypothetical protein